VLLIVRVKFFRRGSKRKRKFIKRQRPGQEAKDFLNAVGRVVGRFAGDTDYFGKDFVVIALHVPSCAAPEVNAGAAAGSADLLLSFLLGLALDAAW
jgi:hypothetical protein